MGEYRLATVGDALAEYLSDLVIRDRSPRTVATYRSLLRFPTMMLADFDRAYCRAWLADQVRTRKPAGAATAWGALKGFGRWLLEQGYVSVDPVAGIHGPRVPEGPAKALTAVQQEALWRVADETDRMILVLLSAGLRLSEAANARWCDLDGDVLTVVGKGRKRRRVLVTVSENVQAGAKLKSAADVQRSVLMLGLSSDAIYRRFKRMARHAGIPWAHPHMMRHSWATDALRRGLSPLAAKQLGGWSNDRMLAKYARGAIEEAALNEARRLMDAEPPVPG